MDRSDYFQNFSDFLTPPLGFTENLPNKKKKNPRSSSSLGENALLMLEVRGEWLDHFELIGKQQ